MKRKVAAIEASASSSKLNTCTHTYTSRIQYIHQPRAYSKACKDTQGHAHTRTPTYTSSHADAYPYSKWRTSQRCDKTATEHPHFSMHSPTRNTQTHANTHTHTHTHTPHIYSSTCTHDLAHTHKRNCRV